MPQSGIPAVDWEAAPGLRAGFLEISATCREGTLFKDLINIRFKHVLLYSDLGARNHHQLFNKLLITSL